MRRSKVSATCHIDISEEKRFRLEVGDLGADAIGRESHSRPTWTRTRSGRICSGASAPLLRHKQYARRLKCAACRLRGTGQIADSYTPASSRARFVHEHQIAADDRRPKKARPWKGARRNGVVALSVRHMPHGMMNLPTRGHDEVTSCESSNLMRHENSPGRLGLNGAALNMPERRDARDIGRCPQRKMP